MPLTLAHLSRGALAISALLCAFIGLQAAQGQPATAVGKPAASTVETEGIIFERQQIMLQLEKDSGALGEMAAGLRKPDKLAETARSIAQLAKDSVAAFEANVPGGRAKPEVWSNNVDFRQRMEAFATNSEKMAKIAETGNLTGVVEVMTQALPCKDCHDIYRAPKKPAP